MNNTLIEQINSWTGADEHNKVIEALTNLPSSERDFEAIGLLARAYNNLGEYEKALSLLDSTRKEGAENTNWNYRKGYSLYFLGRYAESLVHYRKANELTPDDEDTLEFIRCCNANMPFNKRVEDFWQWFTANEEELSHMVEERSAYDTNHIVEFVSKGTHLLSEDVHYNLGGDHEFTFSVEGDADLFYLYPHLISRMPAQFKEKWHFFPFNQGTDNSFSFCMYGVNIDMEKVRVAVTYQEDGNNFDLSFYEENLCSLTEPQSYNAYYIMMEIMMGEGLTYQYIADVKRADALEGMITLPELRKHITDTLKVHGKEVYDNPQQLYSGYHFEPKESEELRFDVVAGSTCFMPLISNYYQESTELFDHLNQFGAQAVFLAFPFEAENEEERRGVLDFRYQLEDRLSTELLKPEGLGLMLGGAVGQSTCYIDLLLFDKSAFIEKIIPFLEAYPQYRFYLSDFRQHCNLSRLFHATQAKEKKFAKLLQQIVQWNTNDEEQKIIDAILEVPEEERDAELTSLLARAYNNLGQYSTAVEYLLSIEEECREDALWFYRLGYGYYYQAKVEEAQKAFERSLELNPGDEDTEVFITWCREGKGPWNLEMYEEEEMDALDTHIDKHFGESDKVFHEIASPDIHVDIYIINPTPERNYYTLVTVGMGAHCMNIPEELDKGKLERAEVLIYLPANWNINGEEEKDYWPLRWLKILARLPIECNTWLGWGHTVPNGEPFAENTQLSGVLLIDPENVNKEASICELPNGKKVNFYQVIPLYEEEMDFKVAYDAEVLLEKMDIVSAVVDINRVNVCSSLKKI